MADRGWVQCDRSPVGNAVESSPLGRGPFTSWRPCLGIPDRSSAAGFSSSLTPIQLRGPDPDIRTRENYRSYYTKAHETADEIIERLCQKLEKPAPPIYVATSDYLEQRVVFGQGAYRISSRELLEEIRRMKGDISSKNCNGRGTKSQTHLGRKNKGARC